MFLRYLVRGFAAGLGFSAGFMLLFWLQSFYWLGLPGRSPVRVDVPAASPAQSPTFAPSKPYSFNIGKHPEMTIPEGGGVFGVAIVQDGATTGRPSTRQYWLTGDQLWQIDTKGDQPTIARLDYPHADPAESVQERLRTEVFAETSMMQSIDVAGLKRIEAGAPAVDPTLNGTMKRSTEGVVWFLPNSR